MEQLHTKTIDMFFKAILELKTVEECGNFFEDICTIKEIQDISQRLLVASLLDEGKNYVTVSAEADVSSATICRVSRCLNYGTGGYKMILDRLRAAEDAE